MGVTIELLERVRNLTQTEREHFYKNLGMDVFVHFQMFENYPESDFARMVDHLLKKIERGEQ